jgi:hypothetical protein
VQSYANLFTTCPLGAGVVARPYLSLFNSTHFGDSDRMAEMSDAMLGTIGEWRGLTLDARYAFYNTSPIMRSDVHELGARASLDVLAWRRGDASPGPLALRPFAGLYGELDDRRGSEDVYAEVGLEPAWRGIVAGRKVGLSVPVLWGLSPDDYYFDAQGRNEPLGYFAVSVAGSVALPLRHGCAEAILNVTLQYLRLEADSVVTVNEGGRDVFLARMGAGFRF